MRHLRIAAFAAAVFSLTGPAGAAEPHRVPAGNQPRVVRLVETGMSTWLSQPPDQVAGYFSDASCDSCGGVPAQVLADNFLQRHIFGVFMNQAVIWGGYYPGNVPTPAPFQVIFHSDAGGLPGDVICQASVVPSSDVLTGVTVFGVSEHQITLDFPDCTLPDAAYFVEIYTDTGLGTDDWFWESGNVDPVNGIVGFAVAFEAPGVAWLASPDFDFAITLNGDLTPVELQSFVVE